MFGRILKYSILSSLRATDVMFWTLAFPIILAMFFNLAFSGLATTNEFQTVPVAMVIENNNENNNQLKQVIEELKYDSNKKIMNIKYLDKDNAVKELNSGKVDAVITLGSSLSVTVNNNGISQSLVKNIMDSFLQYEDIYKQTASQNPNGIKDVVESINNKTNLIKNTNINGNIVDNTVLYFFSLIAMTCLNGAIIGFDKSMKIQANMSELAARRSIAPTHKIVSILCDFTASIIIHFASILLLLFFLVSVLKINLGTNLLLILLICFIGAIFGVSLGMFIAAAIKLKESVKNAILISTVLMLSFLSGLMFADIKLLIQHNLPILNKINPATLIVDCFYYLTIYNDVSGYVANMTILLGMTLLMIILSLFSIRKHQFKSLTT